MKLFSTRITALLLLIAGTIVPGKSPAIAASGEQSRLNAPDRAGEISPEDVLNPDGTLKLNSDLSGSVDLSGWTVSADPSRGPVFAPATSVSSTATPGHWADFGYGGGDLNNEVLAIAFYQGDLIVGGSFYHAGNVSTANYVARWDGSSWHGLGSSGTGEGPLNTVVNTLYVNGTDLYAGGNFTDVSDGATLTAADFIAKWNGSGWSALGSNGAGNGALNNAVRDIVMIGSNLYAVGYFTDVNDGGSVLTAADYVAKWDGSNWSALGSNGLSNGTFATSPSAVATDGVNLYVGGNFWDINNNGTLLTAGDYVAKWDGFNWSALGGDGAITPNGSLNQNVNDLIYAGGKLYAGGSFTNVNDGGVSLTAADYVAAWDGAHWSALGSDGGGTPNGSLNSTVWHLAAAGGNVYVSGSFTNLNNGGSVLTAGDYVARYDTVGGNWYALGDDGAGNGSLNVPTVRIETDGSTVYVGGSFEGINNGGTFLSQAMYLAAWDGSNWSAAGDIQGPFAYGINDVAIQGTNVYVVGNFRNLANDGTPIPAADSVARWDGSNWHALGSNGSGDGVLNSTAYAVAVSGSDVYVGGYFSNIVDSGVSIPEADYIARFDGTNWHALGSNGAGDGSLNSGVEGIVVDGSSLYARGGFSNVTDATNGTLNAADYIAKWDGSNWSALGADNGGDGVLDAWVNTMAVSGGDLYVGGNFTDPQDGATTLTAADYVARWDGSHWHALGSNGGGNGSISGWVNSIAVLGSNVYVGGNFYYVVDSGTTINEAAYIARWDGSNWHALSSNGAGGGALSNTVYVMTVRGADLYVGGAFTNVNNGGVVIPEADRLARWDGANWSAVGGNGAGDGSLRFDTSYYANVNELAATSTSLYVGGNFANVNDNGTVLPYADQFAEYGFPISTKPTADFEADSISDLGYFRASTGVWGVLQSSAGFSYGSPLFFSWGATGDLMVRGDYDGDGMNDPTVRKPPASGQSAAYRMLLSSTGYDFGSALTVPAGWPGLNDTPAVGDFNGDGIDDPAIFRGNTGVWIIPLSPNFNTYQYYSWGTSGDKPAAVDIDGDGQTDIGYWRPSTGVWGFLKSSAAYSYGSAQFFSWGASTDIPVPADYDGDGLADIAVVIPASGGQSRAYRILLSTQSYNTGASLTLPAGWAGLGDVPVPQDYDGDGKADAGIWRGNTGIWIIPKSSTNNVSYLYAAWGASGDQVVK